MASLSRVTGNQSDIADGEDGFTTVYSPMKSCDRRDEARKTGDGKKGGLGGSGEVSMWASAQGEIAVADQFAQASTLRQNHVPGS